MNWYQVFGTLVFMVIMGRSDVLVAQDQITMKSLLEEMTDRSSLAEWPIAAYTCHQASSYSRDSKDKQNLEQDAQYKTGNFGDPDTPRDWGQGWFENHDFDQYLRTEENNGRMEDVMFEHNGPGAIVRFWATYGELAGSYGGIYRVYIDGEPEPVIEMHNLNFAGKEGLVGKPFSFFLPEKAENPLWRARNLILPIPFNKSCKITYDGAQKYKHIEGWRGHYYQINYRAYESGTAVESFSKHSLLTYKNEIEKAGRLIENPEGEMADEIEKKEMVLKPGKRLKVSLSGERAIHSIITQIDSENYEQALRSVVLEVEFDGKRTIWCPIGQFYGLGYKDLSHETYYITTAKGGSMKAKWTMPFRNNAKINLVNHGSEPVVIKNFEVGHSEYSWTDRTMYFHATWKETRSLETELRSDYNFVSIKGKGVFVGDNLTIFNTFPDTTGINWWGEGDEKIYVDGEDFPSHFGTGTEDYYCYAWCRPQPFSAPMASQPIGEGNKTPGLTSNNRYRLLDAIPFSTEFAFDMEIWHPFRAKLNYSPATFFYAFTETEWTPKEDVDGVQHKVALNKDDIP